MANLRYFLVFSFVIVIGFVSVMWQKDDSPKISFTRPADAPLKNDDLEIHTEPGIVPSTDISMYEPADTENLSFDELGFPVEEELSKQKMAQKISLARQKLAQVEAQNAHKQAQVERIIAKESGAEQSLIEAELAYRIGGWREAWRTGNAQAYFDHYSDNFMPSDGKTLEQWHESRLNRVHPSKAVEIKLDNFDVNYDPVSERSLVTFTQIYSSKDYQDIINKRLVLAKENGQWMIVSETTQ